MIEGADPSTEEGRYASTKAPPLLAPAKHDLVYHGLSSQKYQQVPWEYRVPFNVLMVEPEVGMDPRPQAPLDGCEQLAVCRDLRRG